MRSNVVSPKWSKLPNKFGLIKARRYAILRLCRKTAIPSYRADGNLIRCALNLTMFRWSLLHRLEYDIFLHTSVLPTKKFFEFRVEEFILATFFQKAKREICSKVSTLQG